MNDFLSDQFMQNCKEGIINISITYFSGQTSEAQKMLSQGVDVNFQDKEGNTGSIYASQFGKVEVLRFLIQQGAYLNTQNEEGNTALHYSCERCDKDCILVLLLNGIDPEIKNKNNLKAGEGNMEAKTFLNNIVAEKEAFSVLTAAHKQKLLEIYREIDFDNQGVDQNKAIRFNKFVEGENISAAAAEKDAKDFIKWTAICNKTTANLDEWYFAFSKLYATEASNFDKFVEDYDNAVLKRGKLRQWEMDF